MSTLLVVQVSPRGEASISRTLTEEFVEAWRAAHPDGTVVVRDVGKYDIAYLDELWTVATFVPPAQRTPDMVDCLRESDALVAELVEADEVVIGTPMYNFSPPAALKAWIDQVVRFGVTFTLEGGLLTDKPVTVIVSSRHVYTPGSPMESVDFLTPFLRHIFAYMGLTSFHAILAGDFISLRTGQVTREQHLARYLPAVRAAA